MSQCICVISKDGERLMPTLRPGRVRHLLNDGKAKIVKRQPFTIQLLYESDTYTQPIEICEDVGYNYIGISIKSKAHEYVSAQYDTLKDEKEKHDDARKYRRTRRNRLRYRKPRFDNRRRDKGWLAPSLEHKKQLNIEVVTTYAGYMPINKAYVEIGQFDTMLLKAIQEGRVVPEGCDYQKGPRYNLATLREAVFYRDKYTCKVCGKNAQKDGAILRVHHMLYWKGRHGNSLNELITCCTKCHTAANHQKGGKLYGFGADKKFANLSGAAFMNAVRYQIVDGISAVMGKSHVQITYGAMTKERRRLLNLDKSHANDAYAMGQFHPTDRREFQHFAKKRRNNRILEKFYDAKYIDSRTGKVATGAELSSGRTNRNHKKDKENLRKYRLKLAPKGKKGNCKGFRSIRKNHYTLQPHDMVLYNGKAYPVKGVHCYGTRVILDAGKAKPLSVAITKVKLICHSGGWVIIKS